MLKVIEAKLLESMSVEDLESEINIYIKNNSNQTIMDIKYNIYETDISPEFVAGDGVTRENRYSALILIGNEI